MKKMGYLILAILLLISTAFASSYLNMPDQKLQNWYDFNNATGATLFDLKGTADGLNSNTIQGLTGKVGLDYNYDGLTSHTLLDDSLMRDGNFSFSFWFKPDAQKQNPGFILGRSGGATSNTSYVIGYYHTTGTLYFQMYNTASTPRTATMTGVSEGQWHLVVATFNKSNGDLNLYVDNGAKSAGDNGFPGSLYTGSQNTYLARDYRTTYRYSGMIDEFAYWTDVLSFTDINNLWNGGNGITYYSDAIDNTIPSVGQTTVSGFTYYGDVINGLGDIIAGPIQNYVDYNFGSNWAVDKNDNIQLYRGISASDNGQYVLTAGNPGYIMISNDYGATFTNKDVNRAEWMDVALSNDGRYGIVAGNGTKLFITDDYGVTWIEQDTNRSWVSVAISDNGQYLTATTAASFIYDSNDYGVTWTPSLISGVWTSITMSGDGKYRYATIGTKANGGACTAGPTMYYSQDYGQTWVNVAINDCFTAVVTNETGQYAVAGGASIFPYIGLIYYTNNYGATWNTSSSYTPVINSYINDISISNDGRYVLFVRNNGATVGYIYSSNNFGVDYNYKITNTVMSRPNVVHITDSSYTFAAENNGGIFKSIRDKRGIDTNSCEYTTDNGITWGAASWNGSTCVYNDFLVIEGQTYTFNIRVKNFAGTFGYGIPTVQYLTASGSVIQFIVRDSIGNSLPNTDINIYNVNPDNTRTYFNSIRADSTGSAYAILRNGSTYSLDIYYGGEYVANEQILISNITPIYVTINTITGGIELPDVNNVYVVWTPSIDFIYMDVTSLVQKITSNNVKDYNVLIYQYKDWNSPDRNIRYSASGACNKNCTLTTLLAGFSINHGAPFYVDVNLGLDNLSRVVFTHKYTKLGGTDANYAPQELIRNVKADFSCSVDDGIPCGPTIIISILLTILFLGSIVMMTGYAGPNGLAVIALALLGIFTYVGWLYWLVYAVIVIGTVLFLGKGVTD